MKEKIFTIGKNIVLCCLVIVGLYKVCEFVVSISPDNQELQQSWVSIVANIHQILQTPLIAIMIVCLITAFFIFMHVGLTWVHEKLPFLK